MLGATKQVRKLGVEKAQKPQVVGVAGERGTLPLFRIGGITIAPIHTVPGEHLPRFAWWPRLFAWLGDAVVAPLAPAHSASRPVAASGCRGLGDRRHRGG